MIVSKVDPQCPKWRKVEKYQEDSTIPEKKTDKSKAAV